MIAKQFFASARQLICLITVIRIRESPLCIWPIKKSVWLSGQNAKTPLKRREIPADERVNEIDLQIAIPRQQFENLNVARL